VLSLICHATGRRRTPEESRHLDAPVSEIREIREIRDVRHARREATRAN